MFIGHYGIGLGAKSLAPKTSLGTLVLAALLADVLWIIFAYAGLEHVAIRPGITAVNALDLYDIAFSHGLVTNVIWAGIFAGFYFFLRHYPRGAVVILAVVLSHWLLDFIAHRPDMPLAPGGHAVFGLGLWNSRLATFVVEGGIWLVGVIAYVRTTRPSTRASTYGFWIMVLLLTALWVVSLKGTSPPNLGAVKIVNSVMFAMTLGWAYWIDSLRTARGENLQSKESLAGSVEA